MEIKINCLLTSTEINKLEIPNRMVVTAAATLMSNVDGYPAENYYSYYEAQAKGEWGLIITEGMAVDERGKSSDRVPGLWEDRQIAAQAALTERIHQYRSRIFAQIFHAGRQTRTDAICGNVPVVPSRIICTETGSMARAMTTSEVDAMALKFGDAALRAKRAGFDGVEIHGGSGYLVNDFFSSRTNKRVDRYGGNILDRCRFALGIIADIKKKCGADFPVGIRISAEEFVPGSLTIDDVKVIATILEDGGLDYLNVFIDADVSAEQTAVKKDVGVDLAAEIKSIVKIPVIGFGKINDPFLADSLLKAGKCDFMGMLKASMADPEMPDKLAAGRFEDIVICIECRHECTGRINKGLPAACVLNPSLGRETEIPIMKAAVKRNVLVVGGGVGGMEAAITAARCGHAVTLIEEDNYLGGRFRYASIPPEKGEITAFIVWQQTQLRKLGVTIIMDTEVTPELLEALEPDVVVIATGAIPFVPSIPGAKKPNVFTPLQVLDGDLLPGSRCVVVGGGIVGGETAHHLMHHGITVAAIVETLPDILADMPNHPRACLLQNFWSSGVEILTRTTAKEILDDGIIVTQDGKDIKLPADFIVMATGSMPDNKLTKQLVGKPFKVVAVGDTVKVRTAFEAIHEGYERALTL